MTVEPESCIAVRRDRRYLVREPRSERMLIEREPNAVINSRRPIMTGMRPLLRGLPRNHTTT